MKRSLAPTAASVLLLGAAGAQSVELSRFELAVLDPARDFRVSGDGAWLVFRVPGDGLDSALYAVRSDGSEDPHALVPPGTGRVFDDYAISADSGSVVYRHEVDVPRLFRAALDGSSAPEELSGSLVPGGQVVAFALAGGRALFRADKETDDAFALWSAPLAGGSPPVRLSPALPASGDVADFRVAADAARALFRADGQAEGVLDLWSAPLDGAGPALRLNPFRPTGGVLADYAISSDGLGVLYRCEQDAEDVIELYVTRADGSLPPQKRSGPLVAGGDVHSFAISADDQRIVYVADAAIDGVNELWSVPTVGGAAARLHAALPAFADVGSYALDPSGARVAFLADDRVDSRMELYLAPLDASALPLRVHPEHLDPPAIPQFAFAGDGARVVYRSGPKLYAAPSDGASPVLEIADGAWPTSSFRVSPDGARVLFEADLLGTRLRDLWSVPADASAPPARVNGELVPYTNGNSPWELEIAPDSSRVYYLANEWPIGLTHLWLGRAPLFSAPAAGGGPSTLLSRGPVREHFAPAAGLELALGGRAAVAVIGGRLCAVATDGSAPPVALSSSLGSPRGLGGYSVSPDGEWVVFLVLDSASSSSSDAQLWAVEASGSSAAFRLDVGVAEPIVSGGGSTFPAANVGLPFRISADSSSVAFTTGETAVWVADIDPDATPRRLSAPGEMPSTLWARFSPDSQRVLYARGDTDQLVSALADASAPPSVLFSPPAAGGGPGWPGSIFARDRARILVTSAPAERALFLARDASSAPWELRSAPCDGSAPAVTLSGALVAGGEVQIGSQADGGFLFTPDGALAVWRADALQDECFELFVAPADGGAPPARVNPALVAGGDVLGFALSADSRWVAYRADQEADGVERVWLAELDGSSAPRAVSPLPSSTWDALSAEFAPDSRRLFLRAAPAPGSPPQLYSAAVAGGAAVRLDGATSAFVGVKETLRFTSFSREVLFAGDVFRTDTCELAACRVDGSSPPRRLNGPIVFGGDVHDAPFAPPHQGASFELADGESRVVYLAKETDNGRLGLYSAPVRKGMFAQRR